MNRPSWANEAKFDNEVKDFVSFECKPYKMKILNVEDMPQYNGFKIRIDVVDPSSELNFTFSNEFRSVPLLPNGQRDWSQWNRRGEYFVSYSEKAKSLFEGFITAVQKSNNGYNWNWDEQSLVNKNIVMVYGEREYLASDGTIKTIIEPRQPRSLEALLRNEIKYPLPVRKYNPNNDKRNNNVGNPYANNTQPQYNAPNNAYNAPNNAFNGNYNNNNYNNYNSQNNENSSQFVTDEDLPF